MPVIQIQLIGELKIRTDQLEVVESDWSARRALELVALLSLTEGQRLVRDQVIEELWPHLGADAGAANLRKAAHNARRTLGDPRAVVLKQGTVALFPDDEIMIDLEVLLKEGGEALRSGDDQRCLEVASRYEGEVLPSLPYESWTLGTRRQIDALRADLYRLGGDWARVTELEPGDEIAYRELMRHELDAGRRHAAIRWFERARRAIVTELGVPPSAEARALYDEAIAGIAEPEQQLIGRGQERSKGLRAIQSASDTETVAVTLAGPAGIGKSALAAEIAKHAESDGWRVARTTVTASSPPYAPLGGLVDDLLLKGRPALDSLPDRTRSILSELAPLAGPAPARESALTRHQVIAALRRLLAMPLETPAHGVLLMVEDAHLSDEATADVLHQIVAGGAGLPLAVLLTQRSGVPVARGLAELNQIERVTTIELNPLNPHSSRELIELLAPEPLNEETSGQIAELSAGNPFFIHELVRSASTAGSELPPSARESILSRFISLGPGSRDRLTTLAISLSELDLASVITLTGLSEGDAFKLLDEALDAEVMMVVGTRYRFRHELVRRALTEELAPHRRVSAHRAAAERLIEAGAHPGLIAHHWLEGNRPDRAAEWLLVAAREAAALGAFADALTAVDALLAEQPESHEALSLRARVLDALGDPTAPEAYAAAANMIGDPEAQELRAMQALAQLKASNPTGALATLSGVTPITTAGRLAEALTLSAAAVLGQYADAETAAAKAAEAHQLAVELGDPGAILDATWAQALASHATGELPARLREYLRTTQQLPELATRVFDGQLCVTERMLYGAVPNSEIIQFSEGLAAEAQRLGAARGHAFALTLRGEAQFLAGNLDEADHDFAEGARLHGQIGAIAGESLSLMGRARVAVYRGIPELAERFLSDALLMARESEVGHHTLDRVYGTMITAAPSPEAALQIVTEAETAIAGPAETCPTCRIAFIVPAAIAAAQAGDLVRAQRYSADCETALAVVALPPAWEAAVCEVRGWLARAEKREDDAVQHFRLAITGFETWQQPLDASRCANLIS